MKPARKKAKTKAKRKRHKRDQVLQLRISKFHLSLLRKIRVRLGWTTNKNSNADVLVLAIESLARIYKISLSVAEPNVKTQPNFNLKIYRTNKKQ